MTASGSIFIFFFKVNTHTGADGEITNTCPSINAFSGTDGA